MLVFIYPSMDDKGSQQISALSISGLAAGQLEVHASGGRSRTRSSCISSSNMTETRMSTLINSFTEIAKERQATPLMPEPTPGVQYEFFAD
ncbi:hypothetical protein PC113_g9293 [Phytophthora cactorum]|uniref:Uncharacterized protein n=1 Tax=Phytophthora cactorum TaxID=29920 RepID=A0A8T0ZA31_9STRA|nr:hypothetical protein PC113_g9293 [Phytophthora cactorum]